MSRKTITSFEALVMAAVFFGLTVVYYNLHRKDEKRNAHIEYLEAQIDTLEMRMSSIEEQIHDMR